MTNERRPPSIHHSSGPTGAGPVTRRVMVSGVVQGVGFRPFVWRLATELGLTGHVRNAGGLVDIVAQGNTADIERFCGRLTRDAPPRARIDAVTVSQVEPLHTATFVIFDSTHDVPRDSRLVPSDSAPCAPCLAEVVDSSNRRSSYPFTSCCDCGPRFTIIEALPYDRARTTMATFPLCGACAEEYADPANRRFHAESLACPSCGPQLVLTNPSGRPLVGDPVTAAARMLSNGLVVAVKGVGGYQLACDALNETAVALLRDRKRRPHKPFAVMVRNLDVARELFALDADDEALLGSWRAPITLVRDRGRLAPSVAPGHRRQGVMLPSTPLHHLLLEAAGRPMVMTSGNRSDEPICVDDSEVVARLGEVADAFLMHDRRIVARCDDSVAAVRLGTPVVLRRARGWAPTPLRLPVPVRPLLAVGAQLQSTFCLAAGEVAYVSQHLGDLDNDDALEAFGEALCHYRGLFGIEPELVAHDLHPDFLSTRFAESLGLPRVAVQHHHAHVVSVMAEHGLRGPVIGVAFDGFGLGSDGTGWGGEFFVADWAQADRAGWLRPLRQPGGDAAVRHPWRMALAYADDAMRLAEARLLLGAACETSVADAVVAQARHGVASPLTSSAGRLFDTVAALAGVCREASYEGQPAMLLEQAANPAATALLPYSIDDTPDGRLVVDTRPLIADVVDLLAAGGAAGDIAGRFHHTMAAVIAHVCRLVRERHGVNTVCLAGGVFANDLLAVAATRRLRTDGFAVHLPREVPPGDGGLCLGQTLVAHTRHAKGKGA